MSDGSLCVRLLFLLSTSPLLTLGSRILLIPCTHKGHVNMFAVTARALKDAGHDVDILVEETRKSLVMEKGADVISYKAHPDGAGVISDSYMAELTKSKDFHLLFSTMTNMSSIAFEGVLNDVKIMKHLENRHYDIALVDGIDFARAIYVLPYILNIPYITLTARHDPWNAGLTSLPSVEHLPGIATPITEDSTLYDRIASLFKSIMVYRNMPPAILQDSYITKHAPTRPKTTFANLFRNSEMWLTNLDTVCLDWPRIHGLHYQFIWGLSLDHPKPVTEELEKFIQEGHSGVILLTFGSALKSIPQEMLLKFLEAFSQTDYQYIIRHGGDMPDKVPSNVKMLTWVPQIDILAHPKTRAFITHGGGNGQVEGLYYAVPMITLPMFGDQMYNAERAEKKGFGVTLNKDTFTVEELLQAIQTVTKVKDYRNQLRQCSEKLRSLPSAQGTILYWTEHVIRFGSEHLKPVSMKVPIWKTFMLDIIAIFVLFVLILYTIILYVICKLYRKLVPVTRDPELPMKKTR